MLTINLKFMFQLDLSDFIFELIESKHDYKKLDSIIINSAPKPYKPSIIPFPSFSY